MKANVKGINLLPKEYIRAQQIRFFKMIGAGILMVEIVGFISFVVIPPKLEAKALQIRLDEITLEITDPRFSNVNQTIQKLEDTKMEVEDWLLKYGHLNKENFVSVKALDSLTARVPLGVTINGITMTPEASDASEYVQRTIAIRGTATQLVSVINYIAVIESIYGVGSVTYQATYDEGLAAYDYTMEVKIAVMTEVTTEEEGAVGATNEAGSDSDSQENGQTKEDDAK